MTGPKTMRSFITKAKDAQSAGEFNPAEQMLRDALAKGGEDYADIHHQLGLVLHAQGGYAEACQHFEHALRLNPKYTEAALDLAITYNDLGRYTEAKAILHESNSKHDSKTDPLTCGKIANLHAQVGNAYRSAGLPRDAILEYRRALGLAPEFVDIRTQLASALIDDGQRSEAAEQLRLILDDHPDFTQAALHLALVTFSEGDKEESRRLLNQILNREPDHPRAGAYLRMLEPNTQSE